MLLIFRYLKFKVFNKTKKKNKVTNEEWLILCKRSSIRITNIEFVDDNISSCETRLYVNKVSKM